MPCNLRRSFCCSFLHISFLPTPIPSIELAPPLVKPTTSPEENAQANNNTKPTLIVIQKMSSDSTSPQNSPQAQLEDSPAQQTVKKIHIKSSRQSKAPVTASTGTDLKGTRTNRCPPPGTEEAKQRTLKASFARCKDDTARAKFLAKHNLKPEDMEKSVKEKQIRSSRKRSLDASDASTPAAEPRKRQALSQGHNPRQSREPVTDPEVRCRRATFEIVVNQPIHQHQLKASEAYYYGARMPHKFCLIARILNIEKTTDNVAPRDYVCLSTSRHREMNGLQALQTIYDLLKIIQSNAGALRCEIQHVAESIASRHGWICPLLSSAMMSSFSSSVLGAGAEILHGQHDLTCESVLQEATYVVDITDVHDPRYCHLAPWTGKSVKTKAHYSTHLGPECFEAKIFPQNLEIYQWTSLLAQWQLVRPSAIFSTWNMAVANLGSQDVTGSNPAETSFWRETIHGHTWGYRNSWLIRDIAERESGVAREIATKETDEQCRIALKRYLPKGSAFHAEHGYFPYATSMTAPGLLALMDFCPNVQELTLAGNDLSHLTSAWEIFARPTPGLVYLNLLHCEIPQERLADIRRIPTLETFIHESTILPGLEGSYEWSLRQGNRRSLKVCLTQVYDAFHLEPHELTSLMDNFISSRDERPLVEKGVGYTSWGVEHPFMGPISALSCLRELGKAFQMNQLPILDQRQQDGLLKKIFSRGYTPDMITGLPVTLQPERWIDLDVNDQGTRLVIAVCHDTGMLYACFHQRSQDLEGPDSTRVVERLAPRQFLAKYKNQLSQGLGRELDRVSAELAVWFGDGMQVPGQSG